MKQLTFLIALLPAFLHANPEGKHRYQALTEVLATQGEERTRSDSQTDLMTAGMPYQDDGEFGFVHIDHDKQQPRICAVLLLAGTGAITWALYNIIDRMLHQSEN